jgi:hypothetical protein
MLTNFEKKGRKRGLTLRYPQEFILPRMSRSSLIRELAPVQISMRLAEPRSKEINATGPILPIKSTSRFDVL